MELTSHARRQLRKLDRTAARRILDALDRLALDPTPAPPVSLPLTGYPGVRRLRVGDHRVVYRPDGDTLVVLVLAVGHRREVYDRL
ncbi:MULTISPECIES: type II toxin-antitoxin system RelE/ParE family toxin [unclassified Pseudonocardia]|uniref:type II toxin-antitoxin system RelE family toxin n=1 Tax=unclassified Pseudonocardia TaxID=2619320 RepID=UPI001BAE9472|nr:MULTISPECIES: type II toxin-antitoxin system RelE/ParE family toxin [unclassified Pseudonocardia]